MARVQVLGLMLREDRDRSTRFLPMEKRVTRLPLILSFTKLSISCGFHRVELRVQQEYRPTSDHELGNLRRLFLFPIPVGTLRSAVAFHTNKCQKSDASRTADHLVEQGLLA